MKDKEEIDYSVYSCMELQEIISNMEDNFPKDKRTKECKDYVKIMNMIFDLYNQRVGWKAYSKIK